MQTTRASVVAFAAPLVATPWLTRLYSPDDFAIAGVFNGVLVMVAGFGSWRLDWMIPNADDDTEALALAVTGLGCGVCIAGLLAAALWLMGGRVGSWRGGEILGPLLFLVPVAVVFSTGRDLLNAWFVRQGDLKIPSSARITQALVRTAVSVGGGVGGLNGGRGLVSGQIAGTIASVGVMSAGLRAQFPTAPRLRRIAMTALKRHLSEATLSVAVTAVLNSSQMFVPLLLIQYFSSTEVGWYSLMQRVAVAPLGIVTTSLGQSFWAEAARLAKDDPDRLRILYMKTTKRLVFVAIPLLMLCLGGPLYVGALFGQDEWTAAGYVLQSLSPMVLGILVFAPLNHLVVHRRQSWQLLADGLRLALVVSIIVISAKAGLGFVLVIFLTSMASLAGYVTLFFLHRKVLS